MSKSSNTTRNTRGSQSKVYELSDNEDYLDRSHINNIVKAVMTGKPVETRGESGHDYLIKREGNGDITVTPVKETDRGMYGVTTIKAQDNSRLTADNTGKIRPATIQERLFQCIADLDDATSIRKYKF